MPDRSFSAPWWVTFDCFGTLVDWHGGFRALLQPLAGDRTSALVRAYHVHERRLEQDRPHRKYRDVLTLGLARAAIDAGVALTPSQTSVLADHWGALPVFHDVEPMLGVLRSAGYRLGVLTNCDDDLFARTEEHFVQPFDEVVTAEAVGRYKPSPGHFLRFEEDMGTRRSHWIHVACSWYHDIAPARDLGIPRIWLDRDRTNDDRGEATIRVESAGDVPWAVARLAATLGGPAGAD